MPSTSFEHRGRTSIAAVAFVLLAAAPLHAQVPPSFFKTFLPSTIGPGSTSTLTFEISTVELPDPVSNLAFTDTLPAGVVLASPASPSTTCTDGVVTAPDGGTIITLSGGRLGADSSCTVSVNVTSSAMGEHVNVSGDLTSSAGNSGSATATLTVDTARPGFSKSFSPATIPVGGTSTLTFTVDNTANADPAENLTFFDNLPSGLFVADPANASTSCGGSIITDPGATAISFFTGSVAAGASCTVSVDVVASLAGLLANVSNELTSTTPPPNPVQRSSGKATAALDVARDFLTKVFTDNPSTPGGTVTLELTVTNFDRTSSAINISFTDDLDATLMGLVAVGLPLADPCGPGSQLSGTSFLTLTGGNLPPQGSCTMTVTLQVPTGATSGTYTNTTSTITADVGGAPVTGAPATDDLVIQAAPRLTKTFLDNPAAAGGTTAVRFTITNTDSTASASGITFFDDLSAFIPGAVATALPAAGFCAGSGTISGSVALVIDNVALGPGTSCSFDVTLALPSDVPDGTYLNRTSPISGTVGETPLTGKAASDSLTVIAAPTLTKVFTDDPVAPGGTVTLELTLSYDDNAPAGATGISFTDDLDATLPGLVAVGLPASDVCGMGSMISGTNLLSFSGGSLPAGGSCTFSVTLQVPAMAAAGDYLNTTSDVTATSLGLAVTSRPASDTLLVSTLSLTKAFTDDPVPPGGTVTLELTLQNLSPTSDATNITFTDNLDATLSGLVAVGLPASGVCGMGSTISGTSLLSFSGGSLPPGGSCTVSVTLQVPGAASPGEYANTTSPVTAVLGGVASTLPPASDTLLVAQPLSISKAFAVSPVAPGATVTLQFTLTNADVHRSATGISFTDDLDNALSGLLAVGLPASDVCGIGSSLSGTNLLSLSGGSLPPGGSCTFGVTVQVPAATPSGTIATNTTNEVSGTVGGAAVTGNSASATLAILDVATGFTKSFSSSPVLPGGSVELRLTITNSSASAALSGLTFTDDLDAVLPGLQALGLPVADVCGIGSRVDGTSVISMTGASVPPGGSCTFAVSLRVPADAPSGTFNNTTSPLAGMADGAAISVAGASADLQVAFLGITKVFGTAMVQPGDTTTLTFLLTNPDPANSAMGITFTDDLDAALPGLVAIGLPQDDVCGAGSQVSGTSLLTLTGGSLPPGGSCSFDVTVRIPVGAPAGTFTNITSAVDAMVGGMAVSGDPAAAAQANLAVQPSVLQIPTLGEWGLLLLAGLLSLLALARLRRT